MLVIIENIIKIWREKRLKDRAEGIYLGVPKLKRIILNLRPAWNYTEGPASGAKRQNKLYCAKAHVHVLLGTCICWEFLTSGYSIRAVQPWDTGDYVLSSWNGVNLVTQPHGNDRGRKDNQGETHRGHVNWLLGNEARLVSSMPQSWYLNTIMLKKSPQDLTCLGYCIKINNYFTVNE